MSRAWFEQLQAACICRGLPDRTIRRMVAELRDHLADAAEEKPAGAGGTACCQPPIEARLGTPDEVAEAARTNLLAGSFAARHPVLTFLVLPIPLTLAGWALMLIATIGLFKLGDRVPWVAMYVKHRSLADWPLVLLYFAPMLEFCVRIQPPVLVTILCCRWSQRALRGGRWSVISCALVAILFGMFSSTFQLPIRPQRGSWAMGFMLPGGREQLLQLLVPPAVALWWTCRGGAFRRQRAMID
jgi:hypothetical protein